MEPAEIGNVGERHVEEYLRNRGYTCNRNTQLPGSTDIEASHSSAKLLIQAKTAVHPEMPADLRPDELRNIKSRAAALGREAWLAQVTINPAGQLVKDIQWRKLT
jgi:Holliday junction resolvase